MLPNRRKNWPDAADHISANIEMYESAYPILHLATLPFYLTITELKDLPRGNDYLECTWFGHIEEVLETLPAHLVLASWGKFCASMPEQRRAEIWGGMIHLPVHIIIKVYD